MVVGGFRSFHVLVTTFVSMLGVWSRILKAGLFGKKAKSGLLATLRTKFKLRFYISMYRLCTQFR